MSNSPLYPSDPPANPFWLNAIQTLTACNMLAIFVPWAISMMRAGRTP